MPVGVTELKYHRKKIKIEPANLRFKLDALVIGHRVDELSFGQDFSLDDQRKMVDHSNVRLDHVIQFFIEEQSQ